MDGGAGRRGNVRQPPVAVKNYLSAMTRLLLLGTGTPAPLAHRAGSSYLVQTGDERLLFDCGPGSVRRLLEAGVNPAGIDHLFLTHLHYDHCVDFAYLVLTRWDQGAGRIPELPVYGPPPLVRMSSRLFAADGAFGPDLQARTEHPGSHFIYEARGGILPRRPPEPRVTEVEDGSRVESAAWTLEVAEVAHVQPQLTCLAYRLTTEETTIVFGGDSAPDAGVRTLVLVHLTEQLETPGVRERVLHEVAEVFDGQVIFGQDRLDVPLGGITTEPVR